MKHHFTRPRKVGPNISYCVHCWKRPTEIVGPNCAGTELPLEPVAQNEGKLVVPVIFKEYTEKVACNRSGCKVPFKHGHGPEGAIILNKKV